MPAPVDFRPDTVILRSGIKGKDKRSPFQKADRVFVVTMFERHGDERGHEVYRGLSYDEAIVASEKARADWSIESPVQDLVA